MKAYKKGRDAVKIGIIGAGAISRFLITALKEQANLEVTSILVRDDNKYKHLAEVNNVQLFTNVDAFLQSNIDIVVEAADIEAVKALVPAILPKKPVVLISVGALADEGLLEQLLALTKKHGNGLHLPAGAIGGLDLLQNAHALGNVTNVSLTTRKPASSLIDQPIKTEQIIFEGPAFEAIQHYPKNMNVSIVLALAGLGFDETKVKLIADPNITQNIHQIAIVGDFGEATVEVKNNPLPSNPKTSYLAALSIIGTLKRMQNELNM